MNTLIEFLLYTPGQTSYLVAFVVLLACGIGVPIPEDITLFAMGLLSYYGLTDIRISILVCMLGVLLGDSIIFFMGQKYGRKLTKKGVFAKLLPPERMKKTEKLFSKMGNKVIFAARFMPGLRAPVYFSAGTLKMPYSVFIFYDGLAALLSVPLLVGIIFYFGDHVDRVIQIARKVQHGIAGLIFAIILVLVLKTFLLKKEK